MSEKTGLAERLVSFCPKVINLRKVESGGDLVANDILSFPDTDLREVYIPRTYFDGEDRILPWFEQRGGVDRVGIRQEQKSRLIDCMDRLKLPPLLAVHLTFNEPERDLAEFMGENQMIEDETTMLLGLYGEAGVGKTSWAKMMAEKGVETVGFDPFSSEGQDKTLKNTMESLLAVFRNGKRPELVLLDLPGTTDAEDRVLDIFDLIATFSFQTLILERDKNVPFEDAIKSYMDLWEGALAEAENNVRLGDKVFRQSLEV